MPSRVFTRAQVLESLSDASARQEQEAIPDFIYYFLRDVFYAVDGDGDGYVTAEAVSCAIPSLLPTRASLVPSSPGSPASPQPSHFLHNSNNDDVHANLMAPGVRHTWCSSSPFLAPTSPAVANRPLDLCGVMQTFWPTVSDKMARLVGDTWSQQSSGSESGSDHDAGSSSSRSSISSNSPHHHRRPVTFSPSPFRGVSLSPPRASAPHHEAAERDESSTLCTSSSCANTSNSNLQGCADVAPEQQRLYHETVRQLWPAAVHDSPLHSSRHCPSPVSRGSPLFPPPKRLLSDAAVAELQRSFAYLDSNDSGFVNEDEVAAALHSLLSRATAEVGDANICRGDLQDVARAMLRLAVASTTRATGGSVGVTAISPHGACGPSTAASPPLCISLPVFVRSFQCDSGAFPADLVAWGVSCSAYARCAQPVSGALTVAAPLHQLAVSLQWMSPLECAVVQDVLARYAAEVSACLTAMKEEAKSEGRTRSQGGQRRGLSQRPSVNTHNAKKPADGQRSQASAETSATPADQYERECRVSVAEWCDHLRSLPVPPCGGDGEPAAAVLPVAVLEASLLHDLRSSLFPAAFDFSMAAGTAAEDVLWAQVQAVCSLALRIAAAEGQPASPASCGENASFSSTTCVDVALLAEVISCDPRCLGLDVLVPLSTRLAAVVAFAQRLPRRVVAEAVKMTSDYLADSVLSACVDGKADSHSNNNTLSPALTRLTDLRRRLMALSPSLARLLTGATRFASGALVLHDCLSVLATQVLTVPPLRLPGAGWQLIEKRPAPPQHLQTKPAASPCAVVCASLRESPVLLKASRGWLRYACRRLLPQERKDVMATLRRNTKAKLYGLARAISASVVGKSRHTPALLESAASDHYAVFFAHVCASHWTCRVDLTVAAHVALLLLASALTTYAAQREVADESRWWCDVEAGLEEWEVMRHKVEDADNGARCASFSSSSFQNEWAMAAVCSTAAEIGARGCRAISAALCHLHSETDTFSHCVTVREEALIAALEHVINEESLWVTQEAGEARTRLVCTLVGCCPRLSNGSVDVTLLLQRWLEAYPLPLSVSHLSLTCPVTEVESVYYTLKRLAASEASERRRSETPSPSRGTSLRRPEAITASGEPETASAMVVTGITPVCLGELLENDAVLAVLYAVSPSESLGVWSGSLCYLERVLRPVLLSPTGVRVSLRKLHGGNTADSSAVAVSAAVVHPTTSARSLGAVDATSLTPSYTCAAQEMLVAMAVPPAVQHAVARLYHLVEAANGVSGAVTEDQLRSYRPHVPAAARYGWHRFVTMLCATTMATSAMSATGGLSAGVLRSHYWRRHGSLTAQGAALEEQASESSVATQRTDDVAATYSCAAMLARVGELRACVQAQLLEERRESSGAATVGSTFPPTSGAAADREANASSAAGTAQWWATYVEVLCRSYSALSW